MTPEQFCYWLQGRVETQPALVPSEKEWEMIGAHLQTVFRKVTPQVTPVKPESMNDYFKRAQEQAQRVVSPGWYQTPQNIC